MYDIEFIMPVCGRPERFLERINAFKDYGLLNISDYNVTMTLLVGSHDIPSITENWPCDVSIIKQKYNHPAPKIYGFYGTLPLDYEKRARWFFKLDDDSITNVGGILEQIDEEFRYYDPHYIFVDSIRDLWGPYRNILESMGFKDKYFPGTKPKFIHEWEGCIVSQKALHDIIQCSDSMAYLCECATVKKGWGDHALAIAAAFCDIKFSNSPYMTKNAAINNFSIFGGLYHHVHYIAPDKKEVWANFINQYFSSRQRIKDINFKKAYIKSKEPKKPKPEPKKETPRAVKLRRAVEQPSDKSKQEKAKIIVKPRKETRRPDKFRRKLKRL